MYPIVYVVSFVVAAAVIIFLIGHKDCSSYTQGTRRETRQVPAFCQSGFQLDHPCH